MSTRLDEIERTAKLGTDCGYFIGEFAFHDILALVAVARAADRYRAAWEAHHKYVPKAGEHYEMLCEALVAARRALADTLAPLLAERATADAGGVK